MVSKTGRESKGIFEYKGEWLDIGCLLYTSDAADE